MGSGRGGAGTLWGVPCMKARLAGPRMFLADGCTAISSRLGSFTLNTFRAVSVSFTITMNLPATLLYVSPGFCALRGAPPPGSGAALPPTQWQNSRGSPVTTELLPASSPQHSRRAAGPESCSHPSRLRGPPQQTDGLAPAARGAPAAGASCPVTELH